MVARRARTGRQHSEAGQPEATAGRSDAPRWRFRINSMQMSMRGAMYVTMTMMLPGLFLQREEPGSEPGNSLVRPDDRGLRVRS